MKIEDFDCLLGGLKLPESPRWRLGRLWFSDIIGRSVAAAGLDGSFELVCEVATRPSGLGWDEDDTLLVASQDGRLLALDDGHLSVRSDHSHMLRTGARPEADVLTNDMVVDEAGRAFIGSFSQSGSGKTPILCVQPDGTAKVVADHLRGPNGMVITDDGQTLIVSDNGADRLVAFRIGEDGALLDERVFAELPAGPDGLCLDAEGAVWVACPRGHTLLRVCDGGQVTHVVPTAGRRPLACMLGGEDRRLLFLATVETVDHTGRTATGRYEVARVDVPGTGLP